MSWKSLVWISLIFFSVTFPCFGQVDIDTKAIQSLVDEWNFANNRRSEETFRKVYAPTLLFYTQRLTRGQAIQRKEDLFRKNPDFRQKITSPIRYTAFTSGITKCEFTRDVREYASWRRLASYLLVSYENNRYVIVGESDAVTDKRSGYSLRLGEPINFAREKGDSIENGLSFDSGFHRKNEEPILSSERPTRSFADTTFLSRERAASVATLTSSETVPIRKDHIFILIGILICGGLMIFIADSIVNTRSDAKRANGRVAASVDSRPDSRSQAAFEHFVLTLFDPLYFRHTRAKREPVLAGGDLQHGTAPDLHFEFHHKDKRAAFAVQCIYRETGGSRARLLPSESLNGFREFEAIYEHDVYLVLGIGGKPDDPKDLYIIPLREVNSESISPSVLSQYRKSGMFFYNALQRKLQ